jgi:hypothetical protein
MAMKAHGDTLLVKSGRLTISHDGITQDLKSAWLGPDGSVLSVSTPPPEPCIRMSLLMVYRTAIVDEAYSLYLISQQ